MRHHCQRVRLTLKSVVRFQGVISVWAVTALLFVVATRVCGAPVELVSPNEQTHGLFGESVSGVPDLNGDGRNDVVIGAPHEYPGDSPIYAGRTYIFDGSTGALLQTLKSPNEELRGYFGTSVSGISDINYDGHGDVLIGASGEGPGDSPEAGGRAYIFDGFTGDLLQTLASPNEEEYGRFGSRVSWIPDVNGDGCGDVVVGANNEDPGDSPDYAGRVYIFDGSTGTLLQTLASPNEEDSLGFFGYSVSGVPDINGDGCGDVVVGAHSEIPHASLITVGRVYIFDGSTGALLKTLVSPNEEASGHFGFSVSGVPDVSGDGIGDVVIGAEREDHGGSPPFAGRAYIFDGSTGTHLRTLASPNEEASGHFGFSVSGVSDVNGDGRGDVVIGARDEDPDGSPLVAGRAYIFDGSTGALLRSLASPNEDELGRFGDSVSGISDINGDGRGDVIIGAHGEDPGASPAEAGRAYIFRSGVVTEPTATPTSTATLTPTPVPCNDSGYYLLDSFGGRHPVGNPPLITGSVYFGFDIARDLERATCSGGGGDRHDLVVMDGFGAAHFVADSECAVSQQFYFGNVPLEDFPKGRAVDLVMTANSSGFWVLTDYGEIYRAGSALGAATDPEVGTGVMGALGFDIPIVRGPGTASLPVERATLRAVSLVAINVDGESLAEGYIVLDSMGGHHQYESDGSPVPPGSRAGASRNAPEWLLDPAFYAWPFFPGLDIARDMEPVASREGVVILDGWGGIHPVPVDVEDNAVYFANNRISNDDPTPAQMVGLPYITTGFDNPTTTDIDEGDGAQVSADAASIFRDLEFTTCGGGLYTMDRFGAVFALGNARENPAEVAAPFEASLYFFPFLYAEDIEFFSADETGFEEPETSFASGITEMALAR